MDNSKYINVYLHCDKEIEPKRFTPPGDRVLSCVMDSCSAVAGFAIRWAKSHPQSIPQVHHELHLQRKPEPVLQNNLYKRCLTINLFLFPKSIVKQFKNMKKTIILLLSLLLSVSPSFSQIISNNDSQSSLAVKDSTFQESSRIGRICANSLHLKPNDEQVCLTIDARETNLHRDYDLVVFQTDIPKPIIVDSLERRYGIYVLLLDCNSKYLRLFHPIAKEIIADSSGTTEVHCVFDILNYKFPFTLEPGRYYQMELFEPSSSARILAGGLKHNNNTIITTTVYINEFEKSYNVTLYDKEGNQYSTGLYISMSGKSFVRVPNTNNSYEQYVLKESDKEDFTFMTIGESEIEPLYIK